MPLLGTIIDVSSEKQPQNGAERGDKMTLQERQAKALTKIGGALGLLDLPEDVRTIIADCQDYETKVKMLELVAENMK